MAEVVHYADEGAGITFLDNVTLAPLPPLCGRGQDGDYMTFFWHEVTCTGCKRAGERAS